MAQPTIRLVCFDLGGVLVRICRSLQEACDLTGLPYHAEADTPELRQARHEVALLHTVGGLEVGTYHARLAELTAGKYSTEELETIDAAWIIDPYPGMEAIARELNALDRLTTGCLSNTTREHWFEMAHVDEANELRPGTPRFPAVPLLEHRAASHLMGLAKPGVEIFHAYAREVDIPGPEILFFDDLAENVAGARAAGWNVEQIDFRGDTAAQVRGHLARYGIELNHQEATA
ncbi:MAG: HAD-IA family hydrolase [Phycisphaerales bacterium JB038]